MENPRIFRCAIYTRTSSEEGLSQDYNSLSAQRDACAAYVQSQKHEGWIRSKDQYDDGGFSGGSLERPALSRLLADIIAGEVDIVVIYKIDRLTRSLRDFARLSDIFSRHSACFVAVTQQFNTTTSMGRLTLNVLLTFAQFEREVAGDRIRDKIASSMQRGIWMGGHPALGYDAVDKKLVINRQEAETVRHIFHRFTEVQSLGALRQELEEAGLVSKRRSIKGQEDYGGVNFTWNPLHQILTNPIYKGMIRHKENVYPGRHEAIIEPSIFDAVQALLKRVSVREKLKRANAHPALLRGLIFDTAGDALYPSHSLQGSKKHRYYISRSLASRRIIRDPSTRIRLSAPVLERYVINTLTQHLRDRNWLSGNIPTARRLHATLREADTLASELERELERNTGLIPQLLRRIEIDRVGIRLFLRRNWLIERLAIRLAKGAPELAGAPIEIAIDRHQLRCGLPMRLVLEKQNAPPAPDVRLVREILRTIRWFDALSSGAYETIKDLAEAEGCSASLITHRIKLGFLAPDIVEAILEGRQPKSMTLASLKRACPLPMSWEQQMSELLVRQTAKGLRDDAR